MTTFVPTKIFFHERIYKTDYEEKRFKAFCQI
jgi:hypothetical protein